MSKTARTSASGNREKLVLTSGIPCPYCGEYQRTVGWLCWHIKHGHTLSELISPACLGAEARQDPDKYVKGKYGHMVRR